MGATTDTETTHTPAAVPRRNTDQRIKDAVEYTRQANRLGYEDINIKGPDSLDTNAIEAKWITPQDPVLATANDGRLPAVPIEEAQKLNDLRDRLEGKPPGFRRPKRTALREAKDGTVHGRRPPTGNTESQQQDEDNEAALRDAIPAQKTNPLFPPMPMYGPPSLIRSAQCYFFRFSAGILSFCFLMVIVLGSAFTSIPLAARHVWLRLNGKHPDQLRPFHAEEVKRRKCRQTEEERWVKQQQRRRRCQSNSNGSDLGRGRQSTDPTPSSTTKHNATKDTDRCDSKQRHDIEDEVNSDNKEYTPTEGGPDALVADLAYYARRVGLDAEPFEVQTEDGFYIELWHLYNPKEYKRLPSEHRAAKSPDLSTDEELSRAQNSLATSSSRHLRNGNSKKRYPVLLIHGLLQSAGAYCCTGDKSLAFHLAKTGYDVWLGNNRCGFRPRHNMLSYSDPRMWSWNIRQMGCMDLPAFIYRVLEETGFDKLGLVCHSQGTTQTLVALAKEQRPEIGDKISVFCGLAPAAYAGPLVRKICLKFMSVITPGMFRLLFGIHAFIPFMMTMHATLPGRLYGAMGYRVFSFLFDWSDQRWERDLRNRMFQFSPVYVSSESMRWWLGRECFARHMCILSTRDEGRLEDEEDREEEEQQNVKHVSDSSGDWPGDGIACHDDNHLHEDHGRYAWYDERVPPMALWVAGNDKLVDGRRLLRRFERGREPHVRLVHQKVIEGYEHLDVIWAMDSLEQVGKEVSQVIWKTASDEARKVCRTPRGCECVETWRPSSLQSNASAEMTSNFTSVSNVTSDQTGNSD